MAELFFGRGNQSRREAGHPSREHGLCEASHRLEGYVPGIEIKSGVAVHLQIDKSRREIEIALLARFFNTRNERILDGHAHRALRSRIESEDLFGTHDVR